MNIGLNALKTLSRRNTQVLDAWFHSDEPPVETPATPAVAAVSSARNMFQSVNFRNSLRSIPAHSSSVPALPSSVQTQDQSAPPSAVPTSPPPAKDSFSPYQMLNQILEPNSRSSQWLAQYGLLGKFTDNQCYVDITMAADGGFNGALRSSDGWRRTVVCRADGTSSQRITGPNGEEILRFSSDGNPLKALAEAGAKA